MKDYSHLFIDGQEVSAFTKDNLLFEGIIKIRDDGTKVVLNESSNTWKRLRDLEHVRRVGTKLYEEEEGSGDLANKILSGMTSATEKNGPNNPIVQNAAKNATHLANQAFKDPKSREKYKTALDLQNEIESTADTLNNPAKAKAVTEINKAVPGLLTESINAAINDTWKQIHPSLRLRENEFDENTLDDEDLEITEEDLAKDIDEADIEADIDVASDFDEDDLDEKEKEKIREEAADYEDEKPSGVSIDEKDEITEEALLFVDEHYEDLEDYIAENYEVSTEEAKEIALKAMRLYMGEESMDAAFDSPPDIEPLQAYGEIEKEFESEIDKFEGDNGELLDHLVDVFEIPEGKAEEIFEEKNGKLAETILGLIDYVKEKLI
jgi:hypothetical protein